MSPYEKIIYKAESPYLDMNGAENYISDTDVTAENIAHNYLDTKLMKRYAGSLEKVEQYFKVKLNSVDIGKYYIQVEGIYRVYLEKKDKPTSFLVKSVGSTPCEEPIGETLIQGGTGADFYIPDSEAECKAAARMTKKSLVWKKKGSVQEEHDAYCEEDDTCKSSDCCPKGKWHDKLYTIPGHDVCTYSCDKDNPLCIPVQIQKWMPDNYGCGQKYVHQFYGTQWYG